MRLAFLPLLALPLFAHAQADDSVVPAATCVKPVLPPIGVALDQKGADKLNAATAAYSACGSAYTSARREIAARHKAISDAQIDATNAFAADFNTYAAALDAYNKSTAPAPDTKKKK